MARGLEWNDCIIGMLQRERESLLKMWWSWWWRYQLSQNRMPRRCPARLATWHRQRSCETVRICSRFSFLSFLCKGNRGYTAWANMYSLLKQHSGKQGGAYARQRHMARVQYIWPVSIVSTLDDLDLISQEVHLPSKGMIVSPTILWQLSIFFNFLSHCSLFHWASPLVAFSCTVVCKILQTSNIQSIHFI